ncbi:MAG TPA: M23 family metallopeptidase [Caulobacteraceae bacterium]|jgi:murein DD-endopeptidase MepM/ murein hydrolase activator NlpD|nr:M23 family metallopeptidase [Caulobacteraceae bacterium]
MRPFPLSLIGLAAAPAVVVLGAAASGAAQAPPPFRLAWPVACELGTTCEIQHYVDHDPSPAAKDYTCGSRTYDAHDGTDIRLPDMAAQRRGAAVLAAADGRVLRTRDGVADVSVKIVGREAVDAIGCGNAVVLTHADGFQTGYCHMAKGSVAVKPGDLVKAGQPIGRVGLSGLTEFPHLHFQVSQGGKTVDPFAYGAATGSCNGGASLWRQTPAYRARAVANAGFADAPPTPDAVENGEIRAPAAGAGTLIAYVRAIGLKAGDVQEMVLRAPDGSVLAQNKAAPLLRDQDLRLMFIGKRKPAQGWPAGRYRASYTVAGADGRVVLSREVAVVM